MFFPPKNHKIWGGGGGGGADPASYSVGGGGSFPRGKVAHMKFSTDIHQALSLRTGGAVFLLPLYDFMVCAEVLISQLLE